MNHTKQAGSALVIGIIIAVVVVGGGAAIYFATQRAEDAPAAPAAGEEQTKPESTESDGAAAESKTLPEGYPADAAPIYTPSTITLATKMGSKWMVVAESNDDIKQVAQSIYDDYKAMGADVSLTPLNEKGVGQVVGGNDGYGLIITYNTDTDKNATIINYDVSPQIKR